MYKANPWVVAALLLSTMSLGLWGCGQQNGAFAAKVREMEARHAKLAQAETRLKEALARVQELGKQVEELQVVVLERDELKKQLTARTGERDAAQTQLSQFSRELQALAGRVEAAAASIPGPAVTIAIPASRKSE